jgi:D-amino-acid dehydrogenase
MADLIIIGGGIVGSSAAYRAVRDGADVILIDAAHPGRATDAGAGIISPVGLDRGAIDPQWARLVAECVAHYRSLFADLDEDAPDDSPPIYRIVGELLPAVDEQDHAWLTAIEDRLASDEGRRLHGVTEPAIRLTGAELRRHWPELRADLTGLLIPEVGRVDGRQLARRLRRAADHAARRGPGRFTELRGEARLEPTGPGPAVQVGAETFRADAVLLAAGAWLGAPPDVLGIGPRISPDKGQIVHLAAPGLDPTSRPVINTRTGGYLLGFDGRVVVGATHEDAGFSAEVTAGGQVAVLSRAIALAPGLAGASLIETRVGLRPVSDDGLPLVGPTALPGVHLANGLAAWGLTLGPLLGSAAARHALGEPADPRFTFLAPTRAR